MFSLRRGVLLALAVFLLPLAAFAQERSTHADRLKQALDLSDAQAALVEGALGDEAEHGDLWRVAAALAPTLTDAQRETLFTRPERKQRGERRGERRGEHRAQRGERRGERRAEHRAEHRAERHAESLAAMQAALGLTDAQVQQLEALHAQRKAEHEAKRAERDAEREQSQAEREQRRAEREARRPAPDELPAEVAALLTVEQQEVMLVHRALAARLHHGRRAHRVRDRARDARQ